MYHLLRCAFFLAIAITSAAGQAVFVERGVDVPGVWRDDRPLYVKGQLGVPRERLDAFAQWLNQNAPNWTILLMQRASGESFRDASGESYSGMDAVEHALGKTLPAATGFGEFKHPETGEKSGAYFILFLEERKFSYHASEVYDKRRLGEDHWIGNLDASAITAMRGGGRIIDAAKDTVTSIDRELQRRIRQETDSRAREAERLRRASEETAASIVEARQRLADLDARLTALRRDFNNPPGDLANPPLAQWAARLDAADRALSQKDPAAAQLAQTAADDIARHIRALADHEAAPSRIQDLQRKIDAVRLHEASTAGQDFLLTARDHLQAAGEAHARADSRHAREIAAAETRLANSLSADAVTRQQIAAARDRAERQRELRKAALITGGGAVLLGILIAGLLGNRRRRAPRQHALELFRTWEATLRERTDGLFELLDRGSRAVGSAATLDRSGWTGETLRLSRQTLADIDHLFILASGIDRVLDQARQLLFPENFASKAVNQVSSSRYQRALELLEKQPIHFSSEDPLRMILQGRELGEWQNLLGRREDQKPFALTFFELNNIFRQRAAQALAALEILANCWTDSQQAIAELDQTLADVAAQERAVHDAATRDGLFSVPAVFDQLLPAARSDHELATTRAAVDPVSALGDEIPRGRQRAADAAASCALVTELRTHAMPVIEGNAKLLSERSRLTEWIEIALESLSSRADDLALSALERGIGEDLQTLSRDATQLAARTTKAVELDERAVSICVPAMSEAGARIERERQRLGGLLELPSAQILRENPSLDPGLALDRARQQHAAALAEIDLGDVGAAENALDASEGNCRAIHELIDATLDAFDAAASSAAEIGKENQRIAALVPPAAGVLENLVGSWSPTALRPSSADPEFPDPEATVANHIQLAEASLLDSRNKLTAAADAHRSGGILQAGDLREEAATANNAAEESLRRIHDQAAAIAATLEANRMRLEKLDTQARHIEQAAAAPQITRPALAEFAAGKDLFGSARHAVQARGTAANPFEAARLLAATAEAFSTVENCFAKDRELHEEVARSLAAAEHEMNAARRLARQTQSDEIPDSPETLRFLQQLEVLERELREASETFSISHGDWQMLDQIADRITAAAARLTGQLRGEVELAERSVQAIRTAHSRVRAASAWHGDHGSTPLQQARAALSGGDYQVALSLAADAGRAADMAMRAMEAEALRRRRAAEREREAARRRQMSRSSFGSSSGSGFGGRSSGSSRSSFGSGSGSSRSSFGSGSGTRRSGW